MFAKTAILLQVPNCAPCSCFSHLKLIVKIPLKKTRIILKWQHSWSLRCLPRRLGLSLEASASMIQAFIDVLPKHPVHSHGLIDAPKVLPYFVESTVGVVFIDSNCSIVATWEIASYRLKPMITPESLQTNAVKKLFEICQKYKLKVRLVDLWSQDGTCKFFFNNQLKGKVSIMKRRRLH